MESSTLEEKLEQRVSRRDVLTLSFRSETKIKQQEFE